MPRNNPHPAHVLGFVRSAARRFLGQADDFHHFHQLVCSCGADRFRVFLSNRKSVAVECTACGRRVTVYDLAFYPAASKIAGVETFRQVEHPEGGIENRVFVMYEYGEAEEDEPVDRDDITWCRVWIENDGGNLSMILDDETA